MKNGATFCPPWRLKIIVKGMRTKSRVLQPLTQRLLIIIVKNPLWRRVRKRRGLVSYQAINSMEKIGRSIMGRSAIVCFTRKSGIPERKYMSLSSEDCFGKISDQKFVKDRLGRALGNRAYAVKHYNKY